MGVRIDRPGIRWWDYHTVGADMEMRIAEGEGKTKARGDAHATRVPLRCVLSPGAPRRSRG